MAKPANATGRLPSVLVAHENRGLNPHIEDKARTLFKARSDSNGRVGVVGFCHGGGSENLSA